MRCEGKIVLVTGAQRGIGQAVALRFAQEGADVALNFLDDKAAAESGAAQITALGRRCCVIQADVSHSRDVRRLVATAERELGPIDVLVNNAGIFPRVPSSSSRKRRGMRCLTPISRAPLSVRRKWPAAWWPPNAPASSSTWPRALPTGGSTRYALYGEQAGHCGSHPRHGAGAGAASHSRQCHRPRVTNTAMPRLGNTEEALRELAQRLPAAAWLSQRILRTSLSSSPPTTPAISLASSSMSTAGII